jgi:D-glycero-D-manno-heptose 1,7-bisphosphate phosphatase
MAEPEKRGAVIFDRDGVLNRDVAYAFRPDQIVWTEDAAAAVRAVNQAGLYAFVATNQSGIGRGYYTEAEMHALHDWMVEALGREGARFDAIAYSPWHPEAEVEAYRRDSDWRKPGPGMIRDLMSRFPVDPARAVMIGDKDTDVQAAQAAGIEGLKFEGGSLLAFIEPVLARLANKQPGVGR